MLAASMFEGFFSAVAWVLGFFYQITQSYGMAIILLTICVMVITAPLTLKSTRSMLQMQRHQPELKKLQAQYKDDREKLNTEMMAFYKENGINPLAGCVPMLIQAPIFIVMYQVLRGITTRSGGNVSGIGRVGGQLSASQPFTPFKVTDQVFEPQHLDTASELYRSLHATSKMSFFGVDLAISPLQALQISVLTSLPFLLLMGGMLVSQIIQNRQIQGRNTSGQVNPQQQAIMKILPFMLPVFSFTFPAGLGLYYFVQGLCRIGLQGYITKAVYGPHHRQTAEAATSEKDAPPSKNPTPPKAPTSPKAVAAQKKANGATPSSAGRKSGEGRRSGSTRPAAGSSDKKRG